MADTKNYGLKGVGNDVQFGKAGGRFVYNTGASDFRATTDGTTLAHLQVLDPVGDTDAATKLYVDNVAAGLDPKESCVAATTANLANFTTTSGGQFTSVPATIDGVTLAEGDRVLVKDQSTQTQNGIYVVTATTTILIRASDHNSDAEINAGNFVFVTEGTTYSDTGWVLQGPDPLTMNSSNLIWVQFSGTGSFTAGDAISLNGTAFDLDFVGGGGLTSATAIAGADQIAFADADNSNAMQLRTMTNVLADLDIVTATANGVLVRTAADTYASRTLTASAVAGDEGISIVNGDGVSGDPTIGIDIVGQTNLTTDDVDDADELLIYHSVAGGTEGVGNYAITASKLKSYMNAGTSTTTITEGDSSVAVADAGAGTVTTTVDGTVQVVTNATTTTFQNGNDVVLNSTSTLTIADLTDNDVLIAGTGGLVEDSGGLLTFNGTTLALTGVQTITTDSATTNADIPTLTLRATSTGTPAAGIGPSIEFESETSAGAPGNVEIGGVLALEATDVTSTSEDFDFVFNLMAAGAAATEAARITSLGGVEATSGTFSGLTANRVTYATTGGLLTDSGNLTFNGTILALTGNADITGDLDVDNINVNGNTISVTDTNGNLILLPNGTGSIIFQNGSAEEILELNDTASAVNGLAITAGATGVAPTITTGTGAEANIDIGFLTNGTGVLSVTAGTGNYEDNVTADDDIPNKKYVDDAIAATGGSGTVDTVLQTSIDLSTPGAKNIGAATGIPANCTITRVMLEIDVATDAATTVTIGDATNGAAAYMTATENDPETTGIYIADLNLTNGGAARQAQATVGGVDGTTGSATCIITFRHA